MQKNKGILFLVTILGFLLWFPSFLRPTELYIENDYFKINTARRFLLGISYFNAQSNEDPTADLTQIANQGFNFIRIWSCWVFQGNDYSVLKSNGSGDFVPSSYWNRFVEVINKCNNRGLIVDITTGPYYEDTAITQINSVEDLKNWNKAIIKYLLMAVGDFKNIYFDICNEVNQTQLHVPFSVSPTQVQDIYNAMRIVENAGNGYKHPITVSVSTNNITTAINYGRYVDFVTMHPNYYNNGTLRVLPITNWKNQITQQIGKKPLHFNEAFRLNYKYSNSCPNCWDKLINSYQPHYKIYVAACRSAKSQYAAGWCFHNCYNALEDSKIPYRCAQLSYVSIGGGPLIDQFQNIPDLIEWDTFINLPIEVHGGAPYKW